MSEIMHAYWWLIPIVVGWIIGLVFMARKK